MALIYSERCVCACRWVGGGAVGEGASAPYSILMLLAGVARPSLSD